MIRREGRVGPPRPETETEDRGTRRPVRDRPEWERAAVVAVAVVILIVGAIAGMNTIIAQLPWGR
jgi:hypothetical protein